MRRWVRERRRRDEGAVAVEAALITPLLLLLVFGIIEFSLLLKDSLGVSSAVRAGARSGSALPRYDGFTQQTANAVAQAASALDLARAGTTLQVFDADTTGNPSAAGCSSKCVTYAWNSSTKAFQPTSGSWDYLSVNACPGDPNQDNIGVRLTYPHSLFTGLFGSSTFSLNETAVMVFEPVPSSTGPCK